MDLTRKIYQPVHEGLSDEQKRDENFHLVKEYLNENNKSVPNDLFKAVYWVVNGITIFHLTKANAIKKAALKYGVTQVSVKTIIDDMGIVSKRALEQQVRGNKEYRLSKVVENHVLRDELKESKLI